MYLLRQGSNLSDIFQRLLWPPLNLPLALRWQMNKSTWNRSESGETSPSQLEVRCLCASDPVRPPWICSLSMSMQALTHTLSHSIMVSNGVGADGVARPAQQTAAE